MWASDRRQKHMSKVYWVPRLVNHWRSILKIFKHKNDDAHKVYTSLDILGSSLLISRHDSYSA